MTEERWQVLCASLGYTFSDVSLLAQALSHRSAGMPHNERLEFLGDAILGFVVSAQFYRQYPKASEGDLSRLRASRVNREVLASLALALHLNDYLTLGVGERRSGGDQRHSILANALEAVIGAIYLDGGMQACEACITRWFGEKAEALARAAPTKDAKTRLQEVLQAKKLPLPDYECRADGLPHAKTFHVTCTVAGLLLETQGTSSSRRKAEQMAAQHFLELLHDPKKNV